MQQESNFKFRTMVTLENVCIWKANMAAMDKINLRDESGKGNNIERL